MGNITVPGNEVEERTKLRCEHVRRAFRVGEMVLVGRLLVKPGHELYVFVTKGSGAGRKRSHADDRHICPR